MTDAPIALTVHDGSRSLPAWRRKLVAEWLLANQIDPKVVSSDDPIHVLTIPYVPTGDDGPWFIKVIVFTQQYVNQEGLKEANLLTHGPVTFQRTVPLTTPFPADPTPGSEGTSPHGKAQGQAAQEAPQEVVRDQEQAGVPDPRQVPCSSGIVHGQSPWNESTAEAGSSRGDQALPEPEEEVRRQEEEVGDR